MNAQHEEEWERGLRISDIDLVGGKVDRYRVESYEELINDTESWNRDTELTSECKYSPYAAYMYARRMEAEHGLRRAAYLYRNAAKKGHLKAMARLLAASSDEIGFEFKCKVVDDFLDSIFDVRYKELSWDRHELIDLKLMFVDLMSPVLEANPESYLCIANGFIDERYDSLFDRFYAEYPDKGSPEGLCTRARRLCRMADLGGMAEAPKLMGEAIGMFSRSLSFPRSAFEMGRMLFCSRWMEPDDREAIRLIGYAKAGSKEYGVREDAGSWMEFFRYEEDPDGGPDMQEYYYLWEDWSVDPPTVRDSRI